MANIPASKKAKIKATINAAREALKATDPNAKTIGDLVWSDPVTDWTKDATEVRDAFAAAGLDPDIYLPSVPDYGTAFSRAVLAVRTTIQGRGYTLLAAARGPNGEPRYSIVAVERNGIVTTDDRACVQCPKDGTSPFVERTSETDEQANDIASLLVHAAKARHEKYTSDDVRQAFLTMLHHYQAQSTRVSPPHTHYFVPAAGVSALDKLGAILADLGWGEISSFEGAYTAKNVQTISTSVEKSLESEIAEFMAECEKFVSVPDSEIKPFMIARRAEAAEALLEKASIYRNLLSMDLDAVTYNVTMVTEKLDDALQRAAAYGSAEPKTTVAPDPV